jgi:hypothetical protein
MELILIASAFVIFLGVWNVVYTAREPSGGDTPQQAAARARFDQMNARIDAARDARIAEDIRRAQAAAALDRLCGRVAELEEAKS